MPVIHISGTVTHDPHGSRFISYVATTRGSTLLCCRCLDVPGKLKGVSHRPDREEVLFVLKGQLVGRRGRVRARDL
jgi:hypothetical protein